MVRCMRSVEKRNESRSRRGFHVYLSRFFLDFKKLSDVEQWNEISEDTGALQQPSDEDSVDSVDSIDIVVSMYIYLHTTSSYLVQPSE